MNKTAVQGTHPVAPIIQVAHDLGFPEIGWTTGNSEGARAAFVRWLEEGKQGPLEYMERNSDLRLNPQGLMEGPVAGFLMVLMSLPAVGAKATELPKGHAYVARYARGRDYHKVMRSRLVKLLEVLQENQPELRGRATVDSAPVLERDLAVQAGLGWIGKNSMFLSPSWGSQVMLGCLILSEKPPGLDAGTPMADHCGSCRACLDACPTGAIAEGVTLDTSKCISCWSIEEKTLPDAAKVAQWGPHLFGCDLCQDPCPWNRFANTSVEGHSLEPRAFLEAPLIDATLERILHDPASLTRGSALGRTGREGLLRNALAVSLNTGHEPPAALLDSLATSNGSLKPIVDWYLSHKLEGVRI